MKAIRLVVLVPDDEARTLDNEKDLVSAFLNYVSPPNDGGIIASINIGEPTQTDYDAAGIDREDEDE